MTDSPWYGTLIAHEDERHVHVQSAVLNEDNYVCRVDAYDEDSIENAALIIAAPDLLESAEELLRVIDALREVNVLGEWPVVREALQPLRVAVAKATGIPDGL